MKIRRTSSELPSLPSDTEAAALRIENLCFQERGPYSFSILPGQCLGLSGDSGAGKTLLLRALADLDSHEGKVFLGSAGQSQIPPPQWRAFVAMLPAESQWWHDRVGEHFPAHADAELTQWFQLLGFGPEVYDWDVQRLSTGERQRLAILRLFSGRPAALLLDEATASLDPDNIAKVETLIRGYQEQFQAPVLWVSHDHSQLERMADTIMYLDADSRLLNLPT